MEKNKQPQNPAEAFNWSKCREPRTTEVLQKDVLGWLAARWLDRVIADCWPQRQTEHGLEKFDPKTVVAEERRNLAEGVFEKHIRETWTLREIETFNPFDFNGEQVQLTRFEIRWWELLWKRLVYICHTYAGAAVALDVRERGLFRRGINGKVITMPTADVDPASGPSVLDLTLHDVQIMLAKARETYVAKIAKIAKIEAYKKAQSKNAKARNKAERTSKANISK